jgi:thiol:disulfide interchange protein
MLRLLSVIAAMRVIAAMLTLTPAVAAAQTPAPSAIYINEGYDPRANPYRDLERAIERASAENKRILIVVGGDWCVWCEILDGFIARNDDVRAAFASSFVLLKVNWSRENENVAFLSGFPESTGYPDFFVLDSNGAYLARQPTEVLESGRDYDRTRMLAFASRWRSN